MIRIEIVEGPGRGEVRDFRQDIVNLGRAASNHLVFEDPYISSEHGQIYLSGERVFYCDLNSTNGSAIRRQGEDRFFRDAREELKPGDHLVLGGKEKPLVIRFLGADAGDGDESERTIVASRSVAQARELGERLGGDSKALAALYRLARDLATAKVRSEMIETLAEALLTAYERAFLVAVYELKSGRFSVLTHRSVGERSGPPGDIPPAARERLSTEQEAMLLEVTGGKSAPGTGTALFAPLLSQGKLSGALRVEVRSGAAVFGSRDLDLLTVFAAHASKSLENLELLEAVRARAQRLSTENEYLREKSQAASDMVGESPAMKHLRSQIQKVCPTDTTVLILGETGTGKELVARAVHEGGPRREHLFVAVNCGAFPENLLESELFGHMKGSFTGATDTKRGIFDVADGGTVFLDEVGELPLAMQVKLLRVLQEGEITPVGSSKPKRVDVRILSATNRDLEKEVKTGRFREDLFYRLNVFPLKVPPLRERREDVATLAVFFLKKIAPRLGRSSLEIEPAALTALSNYHWPGNVRELENEIERAALTADADEPVDASHLSERVLSAAQAVSGGASGQPLGALHARLEEKEKEIIRETLTQTGGNRTRAAEVLGISRQAFMKKISRYGIK
ncbi:MAG: sigma 54-interacting transcriptional regulator [Bdellovibrionota bacterium]